ncbi:hypothetical protein X975_17411, partial [Stegodyphus mimosarum]
MAMAKIMAFCIVLARPGASEDGKFCVPVTMMADVNETVTLVRCQTSSQQS